MTSLFRVRILCLFEGFKYLGCILKPNKYKISYWEWIITLFERMFLRWDNRCISLGGRLIMLRFVFQGIHLFWMHIFQIPNAIIKHIESIIANFIWSGSSFHQRIPLDGLNLIKRLENKGGWRIRNIKYSIRSLPRLVYHVFLRIEVSVIPS